MGAGSWPAFTRSEMRWQVCGNRRADRRRAPEVRLDPGASSPILRFGKMVRGVSTACAQQLRLPNSGGARELESRRAPSRSGASPLMPSLPIAIFTPASRACAGSPPGSRASSGSHSAGRLGERRSVVPAVVTTSFPGRAGAARGVGIDRVGGELGAESLSGCGRFVPPRRRPLIALRSPARFPRGLTRPGPPRGRAPRSPRGAADPGLVGLAVGFARSGGTPSYSSENNRNVLMKRACPEDAGPISPRGRARRRSRSTRGSHVLGLEPGEDAKRGQVRVHRRGVAAAEVSPPLENTMSTESRRSSRARTSGVISLGDHVGFFT